MAGSMNRVTLVGNLGQNPEIRRTQDGKPIANLTIATSESWKDKNTGERKEQTEWHRVVVFAEGLCKIIEQYCKKGDKVLIEGSLKTRKWQDKEGKDRYTTEVQLRPYNGTLLLLSNKRAGAGGDEQSDPRGDDSERSQGGGSSQSGNSKPAPAEDNDEIPF